jgi:hypothetical protein
VAALQFKDEIESEEYVPAAILSEGALLCQPLSLCVHIPFCFSRCFYCGCNKIVTRAVARIERYVPQPRIQCGCAFVGARSRRALVITETELNAIAALAIIGLKTMPKVG